MRFAVACVCVLALSACGGSDSKPEQNETDTDPPTDDAPAQLTGTVVNLYAFALPGISVKVWPADGAAFELVTDADGHFSAAAVATPYDVTLLEPGTGTAYLYVGFTDQSPLVVLTNYATSPLPSSLYAGGAARDASLATRTVFMAESPYSSNALIVSPDQSVSFAFPAPSSLTAVDVEARTLEWVQNAGHVVSYTGYAEASLSVTSTPGSLPLPTETIATREITVRARTATGEHALGVDLQWATRSPIVIELMDPTNESFVLEVPNDARIKTVVRAAGPVGSGLISRVVGPDVATLDMTVPDGLQSFAPADGATVDDTTTFSVTAVADATYDWWFVQGASITHVMTASPSVSAALLKSRGVARPAGSPYQVYVQARIGASSGPFTRERLTQTGQNATDNSGYHQSAVHTVTNL